MDKETLVYVDLDGVPHLMGRLWARARKNNKESATFEYDKAWLENPARFSLEPALQVGPGPFHTPADTPMFGAIGDSAPDRWGRALMRRMERRRAEREGTAPRTLQEIDFLLLVDDEARQGALRFAEREGGPFLREVGVKRIPPLIELPKLLSAAECERWIAATKLIAAERTFVGCGGLAVTDEIKSTIAAQAATRSSLASPWAGGTKPRDRVGSRPASIASTRSGVGGTTGSPSLQPRSSMSSSSSSPVTCES